MPSEWHRLSTYGSIVEADLDRARLEQVGIEARVETDDAGGAYPVLQGAGCHLLVRGDDQDRALEVLGDVLPPPADVGSAADLEAAENEVASRDGGRRLFLGVPLDAFVVLLALGFFGGFLASRAGLFTSDFVVDWTGESLTEDANRDGKADEWTDYHGSLVARFRQDRNFDGEVDATWQYRGGRIASAERDDDFDGRIDAWETWDPTGPRSSTWDTNGDGTPDVTHFFEAGLFARSEYTPNAGRLERVDEYEAGQLRGIYAVDENGDRTPVVLFDALGRVVDVP